MKLKFWKKDKQKKTVTSDTLAEHREEVLEGARKFKYPLQHSKHKILIISTFIVVVVIFASLLLSWLLLYKAQSTGNFAYRISQVVPFPVAKVDGHYISYEDYLFEMRHNEFYLRNHGQEGVDIDSEAGKELILQIKKNALEKVKLDYLVKKLAKENDISVDNKEVDNLVALYRANTGSLEDVLSNFFNWSVDEWQRVLKLQLLRQKLTVALDTETVKEAKSVLRKIDKGKKFDDLVEKHSEDNSTKQQGGLIGTISKSDTTIDPGIIQAAYSLKKGKVSGIVESQHGLHIIKLVEYEDDQAKIAHIMFRFFNLDNYLKEELDKLEVKDYITL